MNEITTPTRMTADEAADIARLMTQHWASPALTEKAFDMLVVAIVDSALSYDEATAGIRNKPHYHRPYLVTTEQPLSPEVTSAGIAAARAALRGKA
jgi:hypothetical protein